jgi:hypothetical protein
MNLNENEFQKFRLTPCQVWLFCSTLSYDRAQPPPVLSRESGELTPGHRHEAHPARPTSCPGTESTVRRRVLHVHVFSPGTRCQTPEVVSVQTCGVFGWC